MRFNPPQNGDTSNPDRPWIDADPALGREGSILTAAAIEHPQREILAAITRFLGDDAPDPADLTQLGAAIAASAAAAAAGALRQAGRLVLGSSASVYLQDADGADAAVYSGIAGTETSIAFGVKRKVATSSGALHFHLPVAACTLRADLFGAGGGGAYTAAASNGSPSSLTWGGGVSSAWGGAGGAEAWHSAASGRAGASGQVSGLHRGMVIPGGGAPGGVGAAQDVGAYASLSQSGAAGGRVSLDLALPAAALLQLTVGAGGAGASSNSGSNGWILLEWLA